MKLATLAILPALALVAAAAPAGREQHYPVPAFTAVDVASPDDVTIRTGPVASVVAFGAPDTLRDVRVAVRGGTLFIARDGGVHRGGVRIAVTLPDLRAARAAGTGVVTVTAAKGRPFAGEMAGTGRLVVTGIDGADATLVSRGTGDIAATGRADSVRIDSGGTGDVDTRLLVVRRAHIVSHGTGAVRPTARYDTRVSADGRGHVTVTGGARCTIADGATTRVTCG